MNKILEQLQPTNIPIEKQLNLLARYLLENFKEEFGAGEGRGEGAIEMSIRLLEKLK